MHRRSKGTGYRQHAWDALAQTSWDTVADLARHVGTSDNALRGYVAALEKRGYIDRRDGRVTLKTMTGPRAPSWSTHTDEFRDWNLQPSLSGEALKAAISLSGLSLSQWLQANGFHPGGASGTRLRQMIAGSRPVSSEMEEAVRRAADVSPLPSQGAGRREVARG